MLTPQRYSPRREQDTARVRARCSSLLPPDGTGIEVLLAAEVARPTALGATVLTSSPVAEHGWTWHVLAARMATSSASSTPRGLLPASPSPSPALS